MHLTHYYIYDGGDHNNENDRETYRNITSMGCLFVSENIIFHEGKLFVSVCLSFKPL